MPIKSKSYLVIFGDSVGFIALLVLKIFVCNYRVKTKFPCDPVVLDIGLLPVLPHALPAHPNHHHNHCYYCLPRNIIAHGDGKYLSDFQCCRFGL